MTGAELKARRERLGKDDAWIDEILGAVKTPHLPTTTDRRWMDERRQACEGGGPGFTAESMECFRAAYAAALDAEEARQAAERGPVEPVEPPGVTVEHFSDGACAVRLNSTVCFRIEHYRLGRETKTDIVTTLSGQHWPAWLARYAADLAEYRARLRAESDRQRKLDAVKAAEEAHRAASEECVRTHRRWLDADRECTKRANALAAARREAGL